MMSMQRYLIHTQVIAHKKPRRSSIFLLLSLSLTHTHGLINTDTHIYTRCVYCISKSVQVCPLFVPIIKNTTAKHTTFGSWQLTISESSSNMQIALLVHLCTGAGLTPLHIYRFLQQFYLFSCQIKGERGPVMGKSHSALQYLLHRSRSIKLSSGSFSSTPAPFSKL